MRPGAWNAVNAMMLSEVEIEVEVSLRSFLFDVLPVLAHFFCSTPRTFHIYSLPSIDVVITQVKAGKSPTHKERPFDSLRAGGKSLPVWNRMELQRRCVGACGGLSRARTGAVQAAECTLPPEGCRISVRGLCAVFGDSTLKITEHATMQDRESNGTNGWFFRKKKEIEFRVQRTPYFIAIANG